MTVKSVKHERKTYPDLLWPPCGREKPLKTLCPVAMHAAFWSNFAQRGLGTLEAWRQVTVRGFRPSLRLRELDRESATLKDVCGHKPKKMCVYAKEYVQPYNLIYSKCSTVHRPKNPTETFQTPTKMVVSCWESRWMLLSWPRQLFVGPNGYSTETRELCRYGFVHKWWYLPTSQ